MADAAVELSIPVADFGKGGSTHSIICYQWLPDTPSSHPPVLCIHGLSRNGRDFDFLARRLSKDRMVLAPDMPGRGRSDWLSDPLAYNYPAYVADVIEILRAQGISKVDWVGTSMGGIIGMMFAATVPGLIHRLVLNDIGTVVAAEGLKRILSYAGSPSSFGMEEDARAELRKRCAAFGIREEAHWQHMYRHSIVEKGGVYSFAYDPGILSTLSADAEIQDIDLWALWGAVQGIPVQLLRGEQSDILRQETALQMQKRHPNLSYHEIEGVGHAPSLMPDDQIAMIENWLNLTDLK